jgi:hypothetical protein
MPHALLLRIGARFFLSISFFVLTPHQLFAQPVSLSDTITITASIPVTNENTPPPPNGGGGGGGGGGAAGGLLLTNANYESAVFKGLAYPGSIISLLKNGAVIAEVPANPNGTFEIRVQNVPAGTYTFGIRAEDTQRLRSSTQVFTVYLSQGVTVTIDGIFIAPTIATDKFEVRRGDPIILFGSTAPNAKVSISVNSVTELIKRVTANANGIWSYTLNSLELARGSYEGKARAITSNDISLFSDPAVFIVGTQNKSRPTTLRGNKRCDINQDGRVNLLDFSILAFWYKRTGFPDKVDLNTDKRVDLSDVSILAYCWTG